MGKCSFLLSKAIHELLPNPTCTSGQKIRGKIKTGISKVRYFDFLQFWIMTCCIFFSYFLEIGFSFHFSHHIQHSNTSFWGRSPNFSSRPRKFFFIFCVVLVRELTFVLAPNPNYFPKPVIVLYPNGKNEKKMHHHGSFQSNFTTTYSLLVESKAGSQFIVE